MRMKRVFLEVVLRDLESTNPYSFTLGGGSRPLDDHHIFLRVLVVVLIKYSFKSVIEHRGGQLFMVPNLASSLTIE